MNKCLLNLELFFGHSGHKGVYLNIKKCIKSMSKDKYTGNNIDEYIYAVHSRKCT